MFTNSRQFWLLIQILWNSRSGGEKHETQQLLFCLQVNCFSQLGAFLSGRKNIIRFEDAADCMNILGFNDISLVSEWRSCYSEEVYVAQRKRIKRSNDFLISLWILLKKGVKFSLENVSADDFLSGHFLLLTGNINFNRSGFLVDIYFNANISSALDILEWGQTFHFIFLKFEFPLLRHIKLENKHEEHLKLRKWRYSLATSMLKENWFVKRNLLRLN